MFLKKKTVIFSALTGVVLAASISAPANASDKMDTFAAMSPKADSECLDTSAQKKSNDEIKEKRVVMPLDKGTYELTSGFGNRESPMAGVGTFHTGTDFAGAEGIPVYSVAAGTVMASGPSEYGQWVVVRHLIDDKIYDSVYGHLIAGSQRVKAGDKVEAGQQIAQEGNTGFSTGPHLHLEIREGGYEKRNYIDAGKWLKANNAGEPSDTIHYKSLKCGSGVVVSTPNVAWGGFENGQVSEDKLCTYGKGFLLECTASHKLAEMNKAFKKEFKKDLPVVKAYQNLAAQKKDTDVVVGKSFFGWGKSVEMNFTHASNEYIPLISEPDYFTDKEYEWINKNGRKYGWINPATNQKDGENPNPGLWVFSNHVNNTESKEALINFAKVNSMSYKWNNNKNRECLVTLWSKDSKWDTSHKAGKETGIASLTANDVKNHSGNIELYKTSGQEQINTGLKYISDKYDNPCDALTTFNSKGKY